jgi:phospholipase C
MEKSVNGLNAALLTANPNALNPENGAGAMNPFRLDRSQAVTPTRITTIKRNKWLFMASPSSPLDTTGLTMGFYDGNTVTAMWNYAQRFAMSDNSYGTNFGPSTPGAINLISAQTNGVTDSESNPRTVRPRPGSR